MIDAIYQNFLREVLHSDETIRYQTIKYNTIDSMLVHPNFGYFSFTVDNSKQFPLLSLRNINVKVFVAEIIWYLSGTIDPIWLRKYTKVWDSFADDDGLVRSSYGHRWRHHFGRDQIQGALNILQKDPTNRQAILVTWDPAADGLDSVRKKNVPCIPMLQLTILNGELVMSVIWRSNDMYLGFPHDIAGFSLLQAMFAQKLGLPIGQMHYTITHAHLYENQVEQAAKLLDVQPQKTPIILDLPPNSLDICMHGTDEERDNLFQAIFQNISSQYHPVQTLKAVKISI